MHNQGWLMIILGVSFVFWTYVWLPINFLAATRAILAWAFDGLFPRKLSEVNERYHTPIYAIALIWIASEVCLYLYVDQIFNTLNGVFAWILSFVLCSIAAMVFPYRRRELWQASPWNGSTLRHPQHHHPRGDLDRLAPVRASTGSGTTRCRASSSWGHTLRWVMVLVIPTGTAVYLIAWFTSKRRGVAVDKVFAEIPPE